VARFCCGDVWRWIDVGARVPPIKWTPRGRFRVFGRLHIEYAFDPFINNFWFDVTNPVEFRTVTGTVMMTIPVVVEVLELL
jgi:hypothetical protein